MFPLSLRANASIRPFMLPSARAMSAFNQGCCLAPQAAPSRVGRQLPSPHPHRIRCLCAARGEGSAYWLRNRPVTGVQCDQRIVLPWLESPELSHSRCICSPAGVLLLWDVYAICAGRYGLDGVPLGITWDSNTLAAVAFAHLTSHDERCLRWQTSSKDSRATACLPVLPAVAL